jgi:hypothetical protein
MNVLNDRHRHPQPFVDRHCPFMTPINPLVINFPFITQSRQNCKLVQLSFIATIFICEDVAVITKARDTAY